MAGFRALIGVKDKPIAYSPAKFAALFGHEQTWAYRLIYAGKVKVITDLGNKMIPSSEVERILENAEEYRWSVKNSKSDDKSAICGE